MCGGENEMSLHLYLAPYLDDEEEDLYIALELDDEEEVQERIEDDDGQAQLRRPHGSGARNVPRTTCRARQRLVKTQDSKGARSSAQ